ncbi:hypothetical protein D3C73_1565160 [compost metagenome]
MWTSGREPCVAMVSKGGDFLSRKNPGFPHAPWKAMGTRCGQVAVSVAAQTFQGAVKICPHYASKPCGAEPALG